jgi:hypothetical protein
MIESDAEIDALCDHLDNCDQCQALLDGFTPSEYEKKFRASLREGENLSEDIQQLFAEQLKNADELSGVIVNKVSAPSGVGKNKQERFDNQQIVGRGHFFNCIKAYDRWHECDVAVKIAKSGCLTSPEHQNQFHHDCHMYSQLSHDHIVPILDFGYWDEECWFMSTRWVDAMPIDRWLIESDADLPLVMDVVEQVCYAIQHAHEKRVIHRHLDFANIIVTENHHAWITDFGFVLDRRYQFDLAEDNKAVSPSLPREFLTRENDRWVDERSDIFSIGKLIEHCVTSTRQTAPVVADSLTPITTQCSQKSRGQRYQTIEELCLAIANSHPSLECFGRE